jgi:hypothetical protein
MGKSFHWYVGLRGLPEGERGFFTASTSGVSSYLICESVRDSGAG